MRFTPFLSCNPHYPRPLLRPSHFPSAADDDTSLVCAMGTSKLFQAVVQKDNSSDPIGSKGSKAFCFLCFPRATTMFKVMKDASPMPETLSTKDKDFLRLCFIRNPAERPTSSMLLEHRFLNNLQQPDVSSSM